MSFAPLPLTFTLETPRCHLRIISLDDIPHIVSASRVEGFCDGMRWDPPESEDELIAPYEANIQCWIDSSAFTFTIEDKETHAFIGRIVTRLQEDGSWDLGFWTHPEQQGKGYMTEVVAKLLEFIFTHLNAEKVIASHADWNLASKKVLENNHMHFIQHIPNAYTKKSAPVSLNLLGITKQQWHKSHNS